LSIVCVVLAAGDSTRLGTPKQLLSLHDEPLVRRAVQAACATSCEHVAVVLGAHAAEVSSALGVCRAHRLYNPAWASGGMSSSMHAAVHWATHTKADALLLCVCDQPHLGAAHLTALITAYARERRSIASRYQGALGVPALIEARYFDRLLAIVGDRGAAPLLRSGIEVGALDWPDGAVDLDTELDVARFRADARLPAADRA
jgi:molybdenum cofactor cytidylyltransferase